MEICGGEVGPRRTDEDCDAVGAGCKAVDESRDVVDEDREAVDEGHDAIDEGGKAVGGDDVLANAWIIDVGCEVVAGDDVTSAPSTAASTSLVTSPLVPRAFALFLEFPNPFTSLV